MSSKWMNSHDISMKYGGRAPTFSFPGREWPNRVLREPPVLFSTDLRDGNQSLPNPMTCEQKLVLFNLLVSIGFKEIEVAYPYANQTEFDFVRLLVETPSLIPEDVLVQVTSPCKKEAITRSVESVRGAKQAILLIYLPSSDNYRNTMLNISEEEWIEHARRSTAYARAATKDSENSASQQTQWTLNFGFEDFANANLATILRCIEAVTAEWSPSKEEKMIISLASSVEASSPNVFADQVEFISKNVSNRDELRISVHTHNDRGGAVASAELASLAGADRVEGCLFGNGERAGNMDLVTYALNLFTQGINPHIDLSNLDNICSICESITGIKIHPRAPYSGEYSMKAFSGTHQDIISKGLRLRALGVENSVPTEIPTWRIPYLPLDPADIGRSLNNVIGINSQSGKGGVSWVVNAGTGIHLPSELAKAFSKSLKDWSSQLGREITSQEICEAFLDACRPKGAHQLNLD